MVTRVRVVLLRFKKNMSSAAVYNQQVFATHMAAGSTYDRLMGMPTAPTAIAEDQPTEDELKYLQFDCGYYHCKYKNPTKTWGELVVDDYPHFLELMTNHVPVLSRTFMALKTHIKTPTEMTIALNTQRLQDTPDYIEQQKERFLELVCTHKGKMNGKTWREIYEKNYPYFFWSVGNTMGRDTKSFDVFRSLLVKQDQLTVDRIEKGKVDRKDIHNKQLLKTRR